MHRNIKSFASHICSFYYCFIFSIVKVASASLPWQGIFLQARRFNATGTVGYWDEPVEASNTRLMRCDDEADTITHRNIAPKSSLEFIWNPPKRNEGPIIFTCDVNFLKVCFLVTQKSFMTILMPKLLSNHLI